VWAGSAMSFVVRRRCFIMGAVEVVRLHDWRVSPAEARDIQSKLAASVSAPEGAIDVNLVAGIDMHSRQARGMARAAVVVLDYPALTPVELAVAEGEVDMPYIPGLLSFRECPLILAACEKIRNTPDLVLVDGQGIAHPRRLGLASHLGLCLDVATIGCAKSILCGTHMPLEDEAGSYAELREHGELVGAAVRTRLGVKPLYVSVGHKIDLSTAIDWVMRCCRGRRLPEPTRVAHLAAGGQLSLGGIEKGTVEKEYA